MPRVPIGGGGKFKPKQRQHLCRPVLLATFCGNWTCFSSLRATGREKGSEFAPAAPATPAAAAEGSGGRPRGSPFRSGRRARCSSCYGDAACGTGPLGLQPHGAEAAGARGPGGGGVPAGPVPQPLLHEAVPLLRERAPGRLADAGVGAGQPERRGGCRDAAPLPGRRPGLQRLAARLRAAGGSQRGWPGRTLSPLALRCRGCRREVGAAAGAVRMRIASWETSGLAGTLQVQDSRRRGES